MVSMRNFSLLLFSLLLLGCNRNPLPQIKDGQKLLQDCTRLHEQFPQGDISKTDWPRSIVVLKPLRVTRGQNDIQIWIHRSGVCYDVFPNPQFSPSNQRTLVPENRVPRNLPRQREAIAKAPLAFPCKNIESPSSRQRC
jgi:hypothetical protein